jgi:hypothetical protein
MPRAERNAACPCGSGKKYKKCHLDADLAIDREQLSEQRPAQEPGPVPEPAPLARRPPRPEPTGHEQRWNVLVEQLGTASPDGMLRLGRAYVESEPEFDEEDAFALIVEFLEPGLETAGRGEEVRPLIELIRQRHPRAYETNVGYFAKRALDEAYESGQDPEPHLLEWARTPTRQFEYFERALEQALFHGRESLALQALETGKQALLDDEELFGHAKRELARMVVEALLTTARTGAVSPTAIALSAAFAVFRPEELTERLAHAERSTPLRLDELAPTAGPQPLAWQLYLLAADFARWLMSAQSWPAGRAALAHLGFDRMLTERVEALLARPEPRDEEFDENGCSPSQPRWLGSPPGLGSLLGLDEKNLSRQFSAQIGMFGTGAYRAAAVLLALPYWRPYLLEVGGDRSRLSDPARWLESGAGRGEGVRLAKQLDGLAGRALAPKNAVCRS